MPEEIYHLNKHGHLEPMIEEPFALEDKLQELVAEYPKLLSGEQMDPNNPRRWILVGREQGIARIVGEGYHWSLDHLFIDQDAIPTLVEVKRSENSEIRRSIVGQMMDYAAHATQTWSVVDIRQVFEERCKTEGKDPKEELTTLLQPDDAPDVDKFWEDVETNLRAARLRLLFVSDSIPAELARVVEFLSEQMPRTEVLAVEIKQFLGETGRTLVPRVIGRTASAPDRSSRKRDKRSVEQVLKAMPTEGARAAAQRLVDIANLNGGTIVRGDTGFSIRWRNTDWSKQYHTVAWIYPVNDKVWMNTKGFTFGMNDWGFEGTPTALREVLIDWSKQFEHDPNTIDASTTAVAPSVNGDSTEHTFAWAISPEDAAESIDLIALRFEKVLSDLNALSLGDGASS